MAIPTYDSGVPALATCSQTSPFVSLFLIALGAIAISVLLVLTSRLIPVERSFHPHPDRETRR